MPKIETVVMLPSLEEVNRAKTIIQDSIDSHVTWAKYRKMQGHEHPEYGDLEHHEKCLKEYAKVMAVLTTVEFCIIEGKKL